MKTFPTPCINVCVVGEFVTTLNLANFLFNQNGIILSQFHVREKRNKRLLLDLEEEIEQSDIVLVASCDVDWNCISILTAFKYDIPVILFDEQTYFFAGAYLENKGTLLLASDTVSGSIRNLISDLGNDQGSAMIGLTLPSSIQSQDYLAYTFSLGLLCNRFKGNLIQDKLIGLECVNEMDGALRLTQMGKSDNPLCDYLIVPNSIPHFFILNQNSSKISAKDYSFYSYPIEQNFTSLVADITNLVSGHSNISKTDEIRKYNISGKLKKNIAAGEKITEEILADRLIPFLGDVNENFDSIPWSLLVGTEVKYDLAVGHKITFSDVEIRPSVSLDIWHEMLKNNFGRIYTSKDSKIDK